MKGGALTRREFLNGSAGILIGGLAPTMRLMAATRTSMPRTTPGQLPGQRLLQGGGAVSIQFDDGWVGTYHAARRMHAEFGVAGVAYVHPHRLDTDHHLTTDQCLLLQRRGWDIANHGPHGDPLGYEPEEFVAALTQSRDTLVEAGVTAWHHYGPAHNRCTEFVRDAALGLGHTTVRANECTVLPGWSWEGQAAHDDIPFSAIDEKLDWAEAAGDRLLSLVFHDVVAENPVGLQSSIDRVLQVVSASLDRDVAVVTFSQVFG